MMRKLLGANTKPLHANPSHRLSFSSSACDLGAVPWVRDVLKRGVLELSSDDGGRS